MTDLHVSDDTTIRALLEQRAREHGDRTYCLWEDRAITFGGLDETVNRLANGLANLGVGAGDRVAAMLPSHPDHVYTVFAIAKLGAVWVPINVHLKGKSLEFIIAHAAPRAIIADAAYRGALVPALENVRDDRSDSAPQLVIWRGGGEGRRFEEIVARASSASPPGSSKAGDVVAIGYTSGTTGMPKGVLVTDKMLRTCATGAAFAADIRSGDVMLMWEAINHIGGSQVLIIPLLRDAKIALLERFSASRFWNQARRYGATQIHYLGGVLQILMKQPPSPEDRNHNVRIAWGGGCTPEIWRSFEERFGVVIREVYGMTECSSLTTVNVAAKVGSVGTPLPYFDVRILDEEGRPLPSGQLGEIVVRERVPGVITAGYFRNDEATHAALPGDGWFHTGDLGSYDEEGFYYFKGRKKDSVRRRGENISAWEVERVVNEHPGVEESALVGVKTDVGEDDLKIFIKPVPTRPRLDPAEFVRWCEERMPYFQVPRYVAFINEFEKTPSQRIKKEQLPRSTDDCWDREAHIRTHP